jgi:glycosyltransferase involved in cell wall biosynthesis
LPSVVLAATSDIATDQRVRKVATTLTEGGYRVTVVGREKRDSLPVGETPFEVVRFRMRWEAGPRFYAEYNARLFALLLARRPDLVNANDLDTLLAAFLASRLTRSALVYDSHEYFTGAPEIEQRPAVKAVWEGIERMVFPRLRHVYTVNESIAGMYREQYGRPVGVVRNLPLRSATFPRRTRAELGLPEDRQIVILQGSGINVDRGAEEAVEAMRYLEGVLLLIVGSGDVLPRLRAMVGEHGLEDRVRILGKRPWAELMGYTAAADLGLTLDKDTNVNYRFSLPNKLFDYLKAGTPVLASRLVEIERVIRAYDVGTIAPSHDPRALADTIRDALSDADRLARWRANTLRASDELAWETQEPYLLATYADALARR